MIARILALTFISLLSLRIVHAGYYGVNHGNIAVFSGASSSSDTDNSGSLSRAAAATYGHGGYVSQSRVMDAGTNNANSYDESDESGDASGSGVASVANAGGMVFNAGQGGVYSTQYYNGGGQMGPVPTGFVRIDTTSAQDLGAQIRASVNQILQRLGIPPQQDFANIQPGQTYVVRNTVPAYYRAAYQVQQPSQYQYQVDQQQPQYQQQSQNQDDTYQSQNVGAEGFSMQQIVVPDGGRAQVAVSASQPVVLTYKVISGPGQSSAAGIAFRVTGASSGTDQNSRVLPGATSGIQSFAGASGNRVNVIAPVQPSSGSSSVIISGAGQSSGVLAGVNSRSQSAGVSRTGSGFGVVSGAGQFNAGSVVGSGSNQNSGLLAGASSAASSFSSGASGDQNISSKVKQPGLGSQYHLTGPYDAVRQQKTQVDQQQDETDDSSGPEDVATTSLPDTTATPAFYTVSSMYQNNNVKVRYVVNQHKKSESSSNVAYEQDS